MDSDISEVLGSIALHALLPAITISRADDGDRVVEALLAGGLPIAEFTLRTAAGLESIRRTANRTDCLVGAGTVVDVEDARAAVDAGARFLVAPGLDDAVVRFAQEQEILILPGVATATEITRARALGLKVVKLFPTGPMGGPALVRALAGPFPGMRFVTTGGLTLADLAPLYAIPAVLAAGGDILTPKAVVDARDFAEITRLTATAVAARCLARPAN